MSLHRKLFDENEIAYCPPQWQSGGGEDLSAGKECAEQALDNSERQGCEQFLDDGHQVEVGTNFRNPIVEDIKNITTFHVDGRSGGRYSMEHAVLGSCHAEPKRHSISFNDAIDLGESLVGECCACFPYKSHETCAIEPLPRRGPVKGEIWRQNFCRAGKIPAVQQFRQVAIYEAPIVVRHSKCSEYSARKLRHDPETSKLITDGRSSLMAQAETSFGETVPDPQNYGVSRTDWRKFHMQELSRVFEVARQLPM